MNESLAIDFRPGEGVVPSILSLLDDEGYTLQGIRLVPAASDRATLRLDVSHCPSSQLKPVAARLTQMDSIIEVIHRADACC